MKERLSRKLKLFAGAPRDVTDAFDERAVKKKFAAGQMLAFENSECGQFFIVVDGTIRVYKIGESGREITLYRVGQQQTCVLTAFSILSRTGFPAFASADSDLELILVPAAAFRDWISRFPTWRDYIFNTLSRTLNEILSTVERVTFTRIDTRIANHLLKHADVASHSVDITHERLASDLGTGRVVISRALKNLEKKGLVRLHRGRVEISDAKGLQQISEKTLPR
jgi:CRP/FNR family transcriptional regulator